MKEYKIGDTFCLEDGTRLEVVKSTRLCKDCYFLDKESKHCSKPFAAGICSPCIREDKTIVVFNQVNNMEEKRNISISLEEAKEWYNSGDSFKKELALKAYSETELSRDNYSNILVFLKDEAIANSINKAEVYKKLLNISKYYNSIYPKEYSSAFGLQQYYIITKERTSTLYFKYKDFFINKCVCKSEYEIAFNTKEAAKEAIDILGDELNVLFE